MLKTPLVPALPERCRARPKAQRRDPIPPSTPGARVLDRDLTVLAGYHPSRRPVGTARDRAQIRTKAASTSPEWIPGLRLPRRGAQAGGPECLFFYCPFELQEWGYLHATYRSGGTPYHYGGSQPKKCEDLCSFSLFSSSGAYSSVRNASVARSTSACSCAECMLYPAAAQQMRSSISGHARWVDHVSKMSDVHAEHAPGTLMDPTDQWGALGAHVVAAQS